MHVTDIIEGIFLMISFIDMFGFNDLVDLYIIYYYYQQQQHNSFL